LLRVAGQLGIGGDSLRPRSPLADDELAPTDVDGLPFAEVSEVHRAQHGARDAAQPFLVELRRQEGPLGREARPAGEAFLAEKPDSLVHLQPPIVTASPALSKNSAAWRTASGVGTAVPAMG